MVRLFETKTKFDLQQGPDPWFSDNDHWTTPEAHIAFWDERMQG